MKELRIAVTDYYPGVVKALALDNGSGEAFLHIVIVDTGNGCSVYMREEISSEVAEFLTEKKVEGSEYPRLDFLEATANDLIDLLKRGYSLQVTFPQVDDISHLLD